MSFFGKLEDVRLRDLLSMIAVRRLSGKLVLRMEGEAGTILFREGKIIAAASSRDPQTVGSLLVAEKHISKRDLHKAIELQRQGLVEGRLTQVLERMGAVSAAVLEDVIQRKVSRVIEDFLEWSGGFFQFEAARVVGRGEVEIDVSRFVEEAHAIPHWAPDDVAGPTTEPGPDRDPTPAAPTGDPVLAADLLELESPGASMTGEATLAILAAAREELNRGVLFAVRHNHFCSVASVGSEGKESRTPGIEDLRIPRDAPSILRDAAERGTLIRGALEKNEWNRALVEYFGGEWPVEAVVVPAVVGDRTVLVFYGDQLPERRPVGSTPRLQGVMLEVALGMERSLGQRRRQGQFPESFELFSFVDEPPEAEPMAALSKKLDRLIQQNESLLREYRIREQTLWHLAHHDPLTGLPNRFLFRELLAKELAHTRQEGELLAVAIFNIDHFKDVNDHLGEAVGDELLTEIAARISKIVRAEDTLARLGGDEFALVIPKCSQADNAMLVVRRVFDAFAEPFRVQQHQILLSLSMGVSFYPADGRVPGELFLNAEAALRRAKETGRNQFQVFAPTMNEWAQIRMELAQDLRRSIAKNEDLSVLFQPIVAIDSGRIVGSEALLRWKPPDRAAIEARTLVELAEDTGQMPALGAWVLEEACAWNSRWQAELQVVPVWVNVSIRQFQTAGLVKAVTGALHKTGLPPELLRLEITESIAALNVSNVRERLDRLTKLGVAVVLDDFGAGYSSLSYLMRYSLTGLKIDASFVRGVPNSEKACAVVEASISLGQHLGLEVVAEGVEREEHLAFLRNRGCHLAQGTYLSDPLTPEAFQALLRQGHLTWPSLESQREEGTESSSLRRDPARS